MTSGASTGAWWRRGALGVLVVGATLSVASQASASGGTIVSMRVEKGYGAILVVGSSRHNDLNGSSLYEFSGDTKGSLGCTTKRAKGYDLGPSDHVPLTCTGPESDMLRDVSSDDWPALTSNGGAPVAGPGVKASLLGTVNRSGVGEQVTYAGHPLYLFDPWSSPFDPQGEQYLETVAPLAPWHGIWWLVAAATGAPAPGPTTIETERLPTGASALALNADPHVKPVAVSVYTYSRDGATSRCTNECAREWIPVLTTGPARAKGVAASDLGRVRRADGLWQVTYAGHPLYLYARERLYFSGVHLQRTGSAGNGAGRAGPSGGAFHLVALS